MDVHEVTNAEYAACVDDGACESPKLNSSHTRDWYFSNPVFDEYPVIYVTWFDAVAYCQWADKRLPTEAEFEYAARGGLEGKRFPWGDDWDCDDGNFGRTNFFLAWRPCHGHGGLENDTHPVGTYPPNGYGLYDVSGNVWEWTNDWFSDNYYEESPLNDPPGPPESPILSKSIRNGGWHSPPYILIRVSNRDCAARWGFEKSIGFRCARGGAYGP
jgi:formylglycine-generating enzyme required for sulfatase activity